MINNIKILLILTILIFGLTACRAENQIDTKQTGQPADTLKSVAPLTVEWLTNYEQAMKLAEESGKTVLMDFTGSDWCIWCKKLMKEVFTQDDFITYAKENLVLLKIDFPKEIKLPPAETKQNQELFDKFGINSFPTIVLLNSNGIELARTGYQDGGAEKYVEHLKSLLK
jgi:protein disulfide-isomerase